MSIISYINTDVMIKDASLILDEVLDENSVLIIMMDDINKKMQDMQDAHGGALRIFTMPSYMALEQQWVEYNAQYQAL